jgi:transglutaminase-like putative cysteine protease
MRLQISHVTTYVYRNPVEILPHRMMLSPRGSHALRVISAEITCDPTPALEWTQDVFGNLIATASFRHAAERLVITNRIVVEQAASAWPIFAIEPHAQRHPFDYSCDDRKDLGALVVPEHADPDGRLATWASALVHGTDTDTLSLLKDVNAAAGYGITYVTREKLGTQSPQETLDLGSGSCRDLATLFIEAARHLGFAARAVSGYLLDAPISDDLSNVNDQHGATHAWAEVYLPGAGWIAFDPTNGRMGEAHLVPVVVGRNVAQLSPVDGRYVGTADAFLDMTIEVTVSSTRQSADLDSKDPSWKRD